MGRKGIILAGGSGSRLFPITNVINKQLLPIYDKPMIYYPLSTLMLLGLRNILIITNQRDLESYKYLLRNCKAWGINITFEVQNQPNGLAESFLIGEKFIQNNPVTLILGDNLFYGDGLPSQLKNISADEAGATILACPVRDPERYGVVEFSEEGKVLSLEEKPLKPKSRYAITGLYFYDETVVNRAKLLKPSNRGELEITDLNQSYLRDEKLKVKFMSRGMTWLDTGTHDSLHEASSFVRTIEHRQDLKIGCIEEIAWRNGWITNDELKELAKPLLKNDYGKYLLKLLDNSNYKGG